MESNLCKYIVGSSVSKINLYSDAAKEKLSEKRIRIIPVSRTFQEKKDYLSELQSVQPKTAALHSFEEYDKEFIHMESAVVAKLPVFVRQFFTENYKTLDDDYLQSFFNEKKKELKMTYEIVVYVKTAMRNQSL